MFLYRGGDVSWAPSVDIYEDSTGWIVFVELAGLSREDLDLTIYSTCVVIRGIKVPPIRDLLAHKLEMYTGGFQREITLPGKIDVNRATASMERGLLRIDLPARERSSVRISVEPGYQRNHKEPE